MSSVCEFDCVVEPIDGAAFHTAWDAKAKALADGHYDDSNVIALRLAIGDCFIASHEDELRREGLIDEHRVATPGLIYALGVVGMVLTRDGLTMPAYGDVVSIALHSMSMRDLLGLIEQEALASCAQYEVERYIDDLLEREGLAPAEAKSSPVLS